MRRHWVGFPLFRVFDAKPPTVYIYVNKRGNKKNYTNYTQTLHFALYLVDFPNVERCIV